VHDLRGATKLLYLTRAFSACGCGRPHCPDLRLFPYAEPRPDLVRCRLRFNPSARLRSRAFPFMARICRRSCLHVCCVLIVSNLHLGAVPLRGPVVEAEQTGKENQMTVTNRDRGESARNALEGFRRETKCDYRDSLGDLLCDLMHFADFHNFDFDAALDRARRHYEEELANDTTPVRNSDLAADLLAVLQQASAALDTAPRFRVPSLGTDSYRIAALCDAAIKRAVPALRKGGAA
jgi:hypothetical protein